MVEIHLLLTILPEFRKLKLNDSSQSYVQNLNINK